MSPKRLLSRFAKSRVPFRSEIIQLLQMRNVFNGTNWLNLRHDRRQREHIVNNLSTLYTFFGKINVKV